MAKAPPVPETDFLKLSGNHAELTRKLRQLTIPEGEVLEFAQHLAERWFRLAEEHLADAAAALKSRSRRAAYSRSYYAAYNASKAVRYLVLGAVSLKGDDHGKAIDLPNDFPGQASWSQRITTLYENRLRADYDNWLSTDSEFSNSAKESVALAQDFLAEARAYLKTQCGLIL